jgi:DNA-binding response OmpR family regulator
MIEVVIPLERASMDSQEVCVWMDAESLHMRVTSSSLRTSAVAIACWLALAGGIFVGCRPKRALVGTQDYVSQSGSSPWTVDSGSGRISIHDRPISLTPKQYALLSLLVSGENRVFSEEEILESIWPHSPYADSNDIRQCVYKIRRRVATVAPGAEACLVNEKGFGYRLEPAELPAQCLEANTTIMESAMTEPSERRSQ